MPQPRSAVILVNPTARGVSKRFDGDRVLRYLRKRGLDVNLEEPSSAADATARGRAAAERGVEVVFAVGGDGSLRAVAAGLAGTSTAVAAVPAGTVNVFAREAGIPQGVRASIDAHLEGQLVPMDLGLTSTGERFLLMASVGWDADIAATTSSRLKRRIGDNAYIVEALRRLPSLRTHMAHWTIGDSEFDDSLALMVISNTRLYGGKVRFTPKSLANDGLLDVCALCPHGVADAVRLAAKLTRAHLEGDAAAITARATRVEVSTPGLPVQLDGDPARETPMTFTVEPAALLVSIPSGPRPPILRWALAHG